MRNFSITLVICMALLCSAWYWPSGFTPNLLVKSSIFELLSEVDEFDLELPLDTIIAQKNTDNRFPARLSYSISRKEEKSWNIELETRGKYRKRICAVPPLKLRFDKEDLEAAGLKKKKKKIKLVTPCLDSWVADEYVLREYLAYQLYTFISDRHLRTHLVKIKYINTQGGSSFKRYGILIEDEDEMADRLDADLCEDCYNFPKGQMHSQANHIVDLFEFMIGNTDYSLPMVRNMKLLQPQDSSEAFVVPYDFDFSGLVNAPYATPNLDYYMETCRDRRFLGCSEDDRELRIASSFLLHKRVKILQYVADFKPLSEESRQNLMDYLESFFTILKKEEVLHYTPAYIRAQEEAADKED
ncbi:MAG: hypothetical protein MRY78_07465 [Saprospiraceae bacterium]|nr:hypothetical protein [Saprospiraceae bacterium]